MATRLSPPSVNRPNNDFLLKSDEMHTEKITFIGVGGKSETESIDGPFPNT